jgi:hypothetical protein
MSLTFTMKPWMLRDWADAVEAGNLDGLVMEMRECADALRAIDRHNLEERLVSEGVYAKTPTSGAFRHFSEEEARDEYWSASGRHVEAVNEAWRRWGPEDRAQMLREYGRPELWEGEKLVEHQGFPWWAPKARRFDEERLAVRSWLGQLLMTAREEAARY